MANDERTEYISRLRHLLLDLIRRLEHDPTEDVIDFALYRLQQISRQLFRFQENVFQEICNLTISAISLLEN
jgi:hypothetical protein